MAPDTSKMNALSTSSIVVMDTVSDANASRMARRGATPAAITGRSVSASLKTHRLDHGGAPAKRTRCVRTPYLHALPEASSAALGSVPE